MLSSFSCLVVESALPSTSIKANGVLALFEFLATPSWVYGLNGLSISPFINLFSGLGFITGKPTSGSLETNRYTDSNGWRKGWALVGVMGLSVPITYHFLIIFHFILCFHYYESIYSNLSGFIWFNCNALFFYWCRLANFGSRFFRSRLSGVRVLGGFEFVFLSYWLAVWRGVVS